MPLGPPLVLPLVPPLKRLALSLIAILLLPGTVHGEEEAAVVEAEAVVAEEVSVAEEDPAVVEEPAAEVQEDRDAEGAAVAKDEAPAEKDADDSFIYMGGAFSLGIENFDLDSDLSSFDEGFGFDIWLGYRMNRWVGLEGRLSHLTGFDSAIGDDPVDIQILAFTGNLKLYPLEGVFQPYGIIGVGNADIKSKSQSQAFKENGSGVLAIFGAGIDIYVLNRFSVLAEVDYVVTAGAISGYEFLTVKAGIQFQF